MRPIKEKLLPDSVLWSSAECHAIYTGKTGFIGHERKGSNCPKKYSSECIHYGISSPQSIILALLIDQDVSSLGHRKICLNPRQKRVGISTKNHRSKYLKTTVLDFK